MNQETKYKRWGWGAVIGLIAVVLIAGLIVAVTMSSPKKAELAEDNSSVVADSSDADASDKTDSTSDKKVDASDKTDSSSDKKVDDKKAESEAKKTDNEKSAERKDDAAEKNVAQNNTTNNSSSYQMPKTGPASDLMAFVVLAVIAGLVAHNVILVNKHA